MDEDRKVYKFRWLMGIFNLLLLTICMFIGFGWFLPMPEWLRPDFSFTLIMALGGTYFLWEWARCFYRLVFVRNFLVLDKQKFVLNTYEKRNVEGYWQDIKTIYVEKTGWIDYVCIELYTYEDDLSLTPHERYYRIVGIPITYSYGTADELLAVLEEYYRKYGKQ